ncbi:MAG: hypothetical protein ACSLE1_05675 [Sphingobium sp.]
MKLPSYKKSWSGRKMFLKVVFRTVASRLMGKKMVSAGAALQGRMLKAALDAGRYPLGIAGFGTGGR